MACLLATKLAKLVGARKNCNNFAETCLKNNIPMVFALIMYLLGLEIRYREGMIVKKNSFQAFLFAARPNTLTASIAPVLVGACIAALDMGIAGQSFGWVGYLLCIAFAIGMQIASNLINDYFDYKSGGDEKGTRLGPPRACAMNWVDLDVMKKWIMLIIGLSLLIAFPLVFFGGWNLIWIGVLCVLFAFLYTTFFASKGLGDLLVLIFFGLVPVNFMYYVETHHFSYDVLILSAGLGFVVDTLLILNNYRDVEQDSICGKKTIAVLLGKRIMPPLYAASGIVGVISTFVLLKNGFWIPVVSVVPYLVLHLISARKMKKIGKGRELNKVLESTATNIFVFGFLLSAGLLIQKFVL